MFYEYFDGCIKVGVSRSFSMSILYKPKLWQNIWEISEYGLDLPCFILRIPIYDLLDNIENYLRLVAKMCVVKDTNNKTTYFTATKRSLLYSVFWTFFSIRYRYSDAGRYATNDAKHAVQMFGKYIKCLFSKRENN